MLGHSETRTLGHQDNGWGWGPNLPQQCCDFLSSFGQTEDNCVMPEESVNEEDPTNITETNSLVSKPKYDDLSDQLDVQTDKKLRDSVCIASESGYVSSDGHSDSEDSNIDLRYEASDNDHIQQERIASIFLF